MEVTWTKVYTGHFKILRWARHLPIRSVFWGANRTCARSRSGVWVSALALISLGWQTVLRLLMLSRHYFPSLSGCAGPHTSSGAAQTVSNCWPDLVINPGSWHELPQTLLSLNQHDSTWRINNLETECSTWSCELGGWLLFEATI